jgi:hypothetical protein
MRTSTRPMLRDIFEYGYDEIAAVVGKSEANCR